MSKKRTREQNLRLVLKPKDRNEYKKVVYYYDPARGVIDNQIITRADYCTTQNPNISRVNHATIEIHWNLDNPENSNIILVSNIKRCFVFHVKQEIGVRIRDGQREIALHKDQIYLACRNLGNNDWVACFDIFFRFDFREHK